MDHSRIAATLLLFISLPSLLLIPPISGQNAVTSTTLAYTGQFPFSGSTSCGLFITYFAAGKGQSVHVIFSSSVATDLYIVTSSQYFQYNANVVSRTCPPAYLSKIGTSATKLATDFVPPATDLYYVWFGYQTPSTSMPYFTIEFDGVLTATPTTVIELTATSNIPASNASTIVTSTTAPSGKSETGLLVAIGLMAVLIIGLIGIVIAIRTTKVRSKRKRKRRRVIKR